MATLTTFVAGTVISPTDVNSNFSALNTEVRLPAVGGTGLASFTVGDLLYASASTTLAKLVSVAFGRVLVSGGVAAAPAWNASIIISASGSVRIGAAAAIATDATVGHFTFPFCSGIPTGTPENGTASAVVDSSNNRFYVFSNAAWRFVALT